MTYPAGKAHGKKGQPSNLALLSREDSLAEPIEWLDWPEVNNPTWFETILGHVHNLRYPRKDYASGHSRATTSHIDDAIRRLAETPAKKHFLPMTKHQPPVPDLRLSGARRDRAIEISRNLLDITRRDPYLIRFVATGYCWAAKESMRVYLKDQREADFGKHLILVVRDLKLSYRLVGFDKEKEQTNSKEWLDWLDLIGNEVIFEGVRDPSKPAELGHLAIDVMIPELTRKSREFHEVMLAAAAAELWRCVAPRPMQYQESFDLVGKGEDRCSNCPYFPRPEVVPQSSFTERGQGA